MSGVLCGRSVQEYFSPGLAPAVPCAGWSPTFSRGGVSCGRAWDACAGESARDSALQCFPQTKPRPQGTAPALGPEEDTGSACAAFPYPTRGGSSPSCPLVPGRQSQRHPLMKISWVHKAHREIVCSAGEGNVGHCLISSRDECWEKHKGCCSQICAKAPHRSDGTVLSCAAVCTVVGLWCCVMDVQKIPVSWLFPKTLYCCIWQGGICGARILDGQISCWQYTARTYVATSFKFPLISCQ